MNPTWLPMLIPETKLCGANRDARLMLEIYHRRRCGHWPGSVLRACAPFSPSFGSAGSRTALSPPLRRRCPSCCSCLAAALCRWLALDTSDQCLTELRYVGHHVGKGPGSFSHAASDTTVRRVTRRSVDC